MDANARAAARSAAGLPQELQQSRDNNAPHPRLGGSAGYPLWYREMVMDHATLHGNQAASDRYGVSLASILRWTDRIIPYRQTGGSERSNLVGNDLLLMAIFLLIWPTATGDEIAAFIFNNGGELYTREAISARMTELEITNKVASTEAYQAMEPINVLKAELFWSQPPPLGIVTIFIYQLIDFDEMGIGLEQVQTGKGHAHKSIRIRKTGHYSKHTKITVIMAIEPGDPRLLPHVDGSRERPRRWYWIRQVAGTTALDTANFLNDMLTGLETNPSPNGLDNHRVILCDNLNSHKVPIVKYTVATRPAPHQDKRYQLVYRPPYQPKYGPIEYVFAELGRQLEKLVQQTWTDDDLEHHIGIIADNLGMNGKFHNTFVHCGYQA